MALLVEKTVTGREHKVKDLSQADFGRKEIHLAELELSGLMACRAEFGPHQPLRGARITGSLHMTSQTAVLIETLTALGAEVRWCSCNMFSTQDHAAAAIARDSASVFAWKGETLQEYWWCTERALEWGHGGGPDLIVDDGGNLTLLIHEGVKAEEEFFRSGNIPDPSSTTDPEVQIVLGLTKDSLKEDPFKYHKMKARLVGVSEDTTMGVDRLHLMQDSGSLLFPAINVSDSVTKKKFGNLYSCIRSLPDGLFRATDIVIAGKIAVVCGYGDVGKGCAAAMKAAGARVIVTEINPISALEACLEGIFVVTLEEVVSIADIFVTTTGNKDIIMVDHMKKMKNDAIICNIGYFDKDQTALTLCFSLDNLYGCRHSLPYGLMRATDVMIAGKVVVVCGYGDVGKRCAAAMKAAGARIIVTEIDPVCALQARIEGIPILTLEDVVSTADIFVTTTGNKDIIMVDVMRKMKNTAIVCNIGHFDNEIDMHGLETYPGVKKITMKPQTDRWVFPETNSGIIVLAEGRLMNLGCATGHPSFFMSCSLTNQVIAQLELWNERRTGKYEKKVYVLPKHLDEKVAALHLPKLGATLTKLSPE